MTKESKVPSEFPSDWHFEQYVKDLKRELEGAEHRLAELKTMDTPEKVMAEAEGTVKAVRDQLSGYMMKGKSKRPASGAETR